VCDSVERSAAVSLDLKALNSYKTKNFRREKMEAFGVPGGKIQQNVCIV